MGIRWCLRRDLVVRPVLVWRYPVRDIISRLLHQPLQDHKVFESWRREESGGIGGREVCKSQLIFALVYAASKAIGTSIKNKIFHWRFHYLSRQSTPIPTPSIPSQHTCQLLLRLLLIPSPPFRQRNCTPHYIPKLPLVIRR